jgi:Protein of unknown function, DUF547
MKRIYIYLMMLFILPLISVAAEKKVAGWRDSYGMLLKRFVKVKRFKGSENAYVDYAGIRKSGKIPAIRAALAKVKSLKGMNKQEKLAFWLNAYNFLTIAKVVDNPGIRKLSDLSKLFNSVWKQDAGLVLGKQRSLDEIEHKIIRKNFTEPRIHFALVCAAKSCPDLRKEIYCGKKLNAQLKNQLRRFAANPDKGVKIDRKTRTIYLSMIFNWFGGDFPGGVMAWLNKQGILNKAEEKYKVKYLNYNWNLNKL